MDSIQREHKMYAGAGAMVLVLISLFVAWAGAGGFNVKGTDFSSWWLLALIPAIVAGAIFVMEAIDFPPPAPFLNLGLAAVMTVIVFTWTFSHFIDLEGGRKFGAYLGLIGGIVGLAVVVLTRDEQ